MTSISNSFQFDFGDGRGAVPAYEHPNGGAVVEASLLVSVDPAAFIHRSVKLFGRLTVDAHASISAYVSLGHRAYIGRNARIGPHAMIGNGAFIYANAHIGANAIIDDHAHIGRGACIGDGACIDHNVIIGYGVCVADGTRISYEDRYLTIAGYIGSRRGLLTATLAPSGEIRLWVGCKHDITLDQLRAKVTETHKNNLYAREYAAAIAFIEAWAKVQMEGIVR